MEALEAAEKKLQKELGQSRVSHLRAYGIHFALLLSRFCRNRSKEPARPSTARFTLLPIRSFCMSSFHNS
jgi:hypothetical protein